MHLECGLVVEVRAQMLRSYPISSYIQSHNLETLEEVQTDIMLSTLHIEPTNVQTYLRRLEDYLFVGLCTLPLHSDPQEPADSQADGLYSEGHLPKGTAPALRRSPGPVLLIKHLRIPPCSLLELRPALLQGAMHKVKYHFHVSMFLLK